MLSAYYFLFFISTATKNEFLIILFDEISLDTWIIKDTWS